MIEVQRLSNSPCRGCGASNLFEATAYRTLKRVSSDCRAIQGNGKLFECADCGLTQKVVDSILKNELSTIYSKYQTYQNNIEPLTFSSGIGEVRTEKIYDQISSLVDLGDQGLVVDIGCGDGSFLKVFRKHQPRWRLVGFDLNENRKSEVEAICGSGQFICSRLLDLPNEVDLISLNYVLEHVDDISSMVGELITTLGSNGVITFLVPDLRRNPFDIIVADHLSHFTRSNVGKQLDEHLALECHEVLGKEILVVGRRKVAAGSDPTQKLDKTGVAEKTVTRLIEIRDQVRELAQRQNGRFGIIGTSVAGSWLSQEVADYPHFFVDEDLRKVGKTHLERKVVGPADIPSNSIVYVPFWQTEASQIIERMSRVTDAQFITPNVPSND
jgi:SAM-dependent methyltransferase